MIRRINEAREGNTNVDVVKELDIILNSFRELLDEAYKKNSYTHVVVLNDLGSYKTKFINLCKRYNLISKEDDYSDIISEIQTYVDCKIIYPSYKVDNGERSEWKIYLVNNEPLAEDIANYIKDMENSDDESDYYASKEINYLLNTYDGDYISHNNSNNIYINRKGMTILGNNLIGEIYEKDVSDGFVEKLYVNPIMVR